MDSSIIRRKYISLFSLRGAVPVIEEISGRIWGFVNKYGANPFQIAGSVVRHPSDILLRLLLGAKSSRFKLV